MKVAVYAIALNEEQFVKRWAKSAQNADALIIGDTGSNDRTIEIARSLGIHIVDASASPWRFDTARNITLNAVPEDFDWCIALDLDEILVSGWREALEKIHPTDINLPEYHFVLDWLEDGSEGLAYYARKVHRRQGFEWKLPIHEALYALPGTEACVGFIPEFKIHHHADHRDKHHRQQPIELLDIAVQEDPENTTVLFYWARTHYHDGNWDQAKQGFLRILEILDDQDLPIERLNIAAEKVMRYLGHIDESNRENWLLNACSRCPDKREPWAVLAEYYFFNNQHEECLDAAEKAFAIQNHKIEHEREPFAWGHRIYEFAALSAYQLGLDEKGDYYANITKEMFDQEQNVGALR